MDSIRTLLLARTLTVVLDPDRVASAATRPTRDADVDKFEDELAQLGYVMSLDLAMTIRRLPYQAILELRTWIVETLTRAIGAHRPTVPLYRGLPTTAPADPSSQYLRRMLTWLITQPVQPCPWCGQVKPIGALDPCGHLVCRACWDEGTFAGCPICHRRIAIGDPFVRPAPAAERVSLHDGALRLLHLGFDLVGAARARFERLVGGTRPLSPEDRAEVEIVIDAMGPKTVGWLPVQIPVAETLAITLARLWMVAADRKAMVVATRGHLASATDVLRIAAVLLGGNPALVEPMRLGSVGRGMRRALLEDMWRRRGLWKRVAERLHPSEYADRLPMVTLAFAAVRQTRLDRATFGPAVRDEARGVATIRITDDRARVMPWASVVEGRLRAGDVRAAVERLGQRPIELVRRVDQLVRVAQRRQPDAIAVVIGAVEAAAPRLAPADLLRIAAHIAQRTHAWPRRVFFPRGDALRAWSEPDLRPALRSDAIGAIVALARAELVDRAAGRRNFARAVIDRGLVDLRAPVGQHARAPASLAWPRGSELAVPATGEPLRLVLHWSHPAGVRADLDLSVALFDHAWRHVATCDAGSVVVGDRALVHSGDQTSAPLPLGASEFVDLDAARLDALGARHAVMVVHPKRHAPFDRRTRGFVGLTTCPGSAGPGTALHRFDLRVASAICVPLVIDLAARRLRWLDIRVPGHSALHQAGGYRAALAHLGRDFADLASSGGRPTLWDLAAIHAIARANVVYVRERAGTIAVYRRRDPEQALGRLARIHAGDDPDGLLDEIPSANAPTWFAVMRDDLSLPDGSTGYVLEPRAAGDPVERLSAGDLIRDLARS